MSPEAQRIAIAEACGWVIHWPEEWRERKITRPNGEKFRPADPRWTLDSFIPDYISDLNAMHRVEEDIFYPTSEYCLNLQKVSGRGDPRNETVYNLLHATAAQRAEALLRTIGKWKEEES